MCVCVVGAARGFQLRTLSQVAATAVVISGVDEIMVAGREDLFVAMAVVKGNFRSSG